MAKPLTQLEREWFVENLGGASPQKPLSQIKREYFISQVGGGPHVPLAELEENWMRNYISTNGGSPAPDDSNLWKLMVIAAGATPTDERSENKRRFFLTA